AGTDSPSIMITCQGRDLRFSLEQREDYLRVLRPDSEHYVALLTCDRVELYEGAGTTPRVVAGHLFRVVSGLESALLGETAIQGQVKRAYLAAQARGLSAEMHRLFQNALRVGKRVRSETGLSRGAMSHGQAVLEAIAALKIDLSNARILVSGINNLNKTVLQYLVRHGAKTIFLANRSYAKALGWSRELGCQAFRLDRLPQISAQADIIISATAAPHLILRADQFTARQSVLIFDLAVPRDIDPHIGLLPNVTLYNNEDLEEIIRRNQNTRAAEVQAAEKIIAEELVKFYG
ncbi:glutamyl-tRNA reductase, partial [Candidatus Termititenax persephonae]